MVIYTALQKGGSVLIPILSNATGHIWQERRYLPYLIFANYKPQIKQNRENNKQI